MASKVSHGRILVVDDHYAAESGGVMHRQRFLDTYAALPFEFVFSTGWDAHVQCYTVDAVLSAVRQYRPSGVLLDLEFGDGSVARQLGFEILPVLLRHAPELPVVVMTRLDREAVWQTCSRLGAVDYLPKPLDARLLWQTLDRYVGDEPKHWLIGQSASLLDAITTVAYASENGRSAVLILGDSGTGKEGMARYVGRHGLRAGKAFVTANLAEIQPEMRQVSLFGSKKGAYTGSVTDRKGFFEQADGGVIFMDEIGEIDKPTQVSLLRVTESGDISPLAASGSTRVDVQIVSATNAQLARMVKNGDFRQDLWARLRQTVVTLPPLSQRREDIPLMLRHILRVQALERKIAVPELPASLESRLMAWPWEDNARGLVRYIIQVLSAPEEKNESLFLAHLARQGRAEVDHLEPHDLSDQPVDATTMASQLATSTDPPLSPAGVQTLCFMEVRLLCRALIATFDDGKFNRAEAAGLLKGRNKRKTPQFDRWFRQVWNKLDAAHRARAEMEFPELVPVIREVLSNSDSSR